MTDREFAIGSQTYRATPLDAFEQFHCVRRLGPIFGALAKAIETGGDDLRPADVAAPIMTALAAVPDADANFVLTTCLRHVTRQQSGGTGWAPLMGAGGQMMFADVDMTEMLQITGQVLQGYLASFLSGLASVSTVAPEARPVSN